MSEELNENLELQNLVTLGLVTNMGQLQSSLQVMVQGMSAITGAIFDGTRGVTDTLQILGKGILTVSNQFGKIKIVNDTLERSLVSTIGSFNDMDQKIGGLGRKGGGALGQGAGEGFNFRELFTEGFDLGGAGSGIGKRLQGLKSVGVGGAKAAGGAILGGISALGPQMLALSLVMKPVTALLGGFLEPLDLITDIFGAVGDILGVLLVPIMKEVGDVLLPILPILVDLVKILLPVIELLLIPLSLLGETMQLLSAGVGFLTGGLANLMDGFGGQVTGFVDGLAETALALISNTDALTENSQSVQDLINAREVTDLQITGATGGFAGKQNLRFDV